MLKEWYSVGWPALGQMLFSWRGGEAMESGKWGCSNKRMAIRQKHHMPTECYYYSYVVYEKIREPLVCNIINKYLNPYYILIIIVDLNQTCLCRSMFFVVIFSHLHIEFWGSVYSTCRTYYVSETICLQWA